MKILLLLFISFSISACAIGKIERTFSDGSKLTLNEYVLGNNLTFEGFNASIGEDKVSVDSAANNQTDALKAIISGIIEGVEKGAAKSIKP